MKHRVYKTLALALALLTLCGLALAEVRATGDIWMRTGPGRSYDKIVSFSKGHVFQYLGETKMDERPVAWYKVSSGKYTGWVSSKYSVLVSENATAAPTPKPTAAPTPKPTAAPAQTGGQAGLPALNAGGLFSDSLGQSTDAPFQPIQTATPTEKPVVELSNYYRDDLATAAKEIGLTSYREVMSEVPYQYYDDSVILAGNQTVENIVVYGGGYEVFGVRVGMNADTAKAWLNAAGLDYVNSANGVTYEHRAAFDAPFMDQNGHDSCINLWVNDENIITEIDWSTYTG